MNKILLVLSIVSVCALLLPTASSNSSTPHVAPTPTSVCPVGTTPRTAPGTATLDYCAPAPNNWNTQDVAPNLTPGPDPLNVIISAHSTVSISDIFAGLNLQRWGAGGCVSNERANVTGSFVTQMDSWRKVGVGGSGRLGACVIGNVLSLNGDENHTRVWNQPISGGQFNAWFISASFETACVQIGKGDMKPVLDNLGYSIVHPSLLWHCIDGSRNPDGSPSSLGINGYDRGADSLVKDLKAAAAYNGWNISDRKDVRPAGKGKRSVPFGSTVYVVTIDYPAEHMFLKVLGGILWPVPSLLDNLLLVSFGIKRRRTYAVLTIIGEIVAIGLIIAGVAIGPLHGSLTGNSGVTIGDPGLRIILIGMILQLVVALLLSIWMWAKVKPGNSPVQVDEESPGSTP